MPPLTRRNHHRTSDTDRYQSVCHDLDVAMLRTSDGVDVAARVWRAAGIPRAGVVIVHGFAAGKDDDGVVGVAEALAGHGFDVVTYDGRGHGASGGTCTLGELERHDVAAVVAHTRERADRVVLVGASMGAVAALRHAVADPTLAGVVTVSCPATWEMPRTPLALLATGLTRTRAGRRVAAAWLRVRVDPLWTNPEPPCDLVGRLDIPIVVLHGARDRFIPPRAGARLHASARDPRRLVLVPDMGHAFDGLARQPIVDAVEWILGAGAGGAGQSA